MLEGVGECLLHDPVGGQIERGRERRAVARDLHLDIQAGGAQAIGQPRQLSDAGCGCERSLVAALVAAENAE